MASGGKDKAILVEATLLDFCNNVGEINHTQIVMISNRIAPNTNGTRVGID